MSRTYRKPPALWRCFRRPKGIRNAKRNNVRHGAIPPSSWDDVKFNQEVWTPFKIAKQLAVLGVDREIIAEKLCAKFKIPKYTAVELAYYWWNVCNAQKAKYGRIITNLPM